jgi:signal transduction histidine kinase
METYFASAERVREDELQQEIESVSQNPVIDGLMNVVSGLLAVLNEQRQILALNETLLEMLGIDDAGKVLGLRPGEALQCVHADEPPNGCGTTEFCSSCGAAIAIVTSLGQNKPIEKKCALTVEKQGQKEDLYLRVHSWPIAFDGRRLLLLFLQDITKQQQWAALERVFFHDLSNLITGLVGTSELLTREAWRGRDELAENVYQLSQRLAREVELQKYLAQGISNYRPLWQEVSVSRIINEIQSVFANHPVAEDKLLCLPPTTPDVTLTTDFHLLMRVLDNMIKNAFEATEKGDAVKVSIEQSANELTFCVWNKEAIPESVAKRIFQRNFSTKPGIGKGLGTYSMKLFGEQFLGGKVSFTTSEIEGTEFRFRLPVGVDRY